MSPIIYGGIKYYQKRHAIYCKKCCEIIESSSEHDYRVCYCGCVAIDGGISPGNRIIGSKNNMEQRSIFIANIENKIIWLPQNIIEEYYRFAIEHT
jgi:hypothetical protein